MHFVGLSIGGMIGQQLALEHPQRLHSLMLTGTSPKAVPGPPDMWPTRFAAIRAADTVAPIADATMTRWFTEAFRPGHENRWQQVWNMVANTSPEGYIGGAEAIIAFDVLERLPEVRMQTLVVCGDDDPGTPAEGNRRIAALIPGRGIGRSPMRGISRWWSIRRCFRGSCWGGWRGGVNAASQSRSRPPWPGPWSIPRCD